MRAHRGPTLLVLGILSLVICGFFGPVVWIMARQDLALMETGEVDSSGRGMTQAGRLLGMFGTLAGVCEIVLMVLVVARWPF